MAIIWSFFKASNDCKAFWVTFLWWWRFVNIPIPMTVDAMRIDWPLLLLCESLEDFRIRFCLWRLMKNSPHCRSAKHRRLNFFWFVLLFQFRHLSLMLVTIKTMCIIWSASLPCQHLEDSFITFRSLFHACSGWSLPSVTNLSCSGRSTWLCESIQIFWMRRLGSPFSSWFSPNLALGLFQS